MEIPKLNSAVLREVDELEETKNSQKISVCNQPNGVHYSANSDSFVIDMNGFSNGGTKEPNTNPRITLQRNLSRKGSQRGGDKMIASNTAPMDRDSSSPTVAVGATMAEKAGAKVAVAVAVGSQQDHLGVAQVHHQITITTANTAAPVERGFLRRNSFRRPSSSWFLDPKKVLLLFATVSCIGSMILIYFTLAIGKPDTEERGFD
ncbi:uncharacterized protein LOC111495477 isoform X1 [Cucurbita maxima]|uniref:Uncharacterized protein LOC111495477 isoform X1 n=1 Tax=Cucurbita maxima TaxID=3661 RepID=A0A6J1KI90_CUCMA|nr:uncharacterized protein LOC111495477 isoform X1 [Cucurbita maxima]XP_023001306.1 uncharacterized protein LOC111495477 isoform X1 [Cucurbita maxima]XP_023001307.1 uncharacterized protein LOC111495477 isoform X1 [Cucurbita maxima]